MYMVIPQVYRVPSIFFNFYHVDLIIILCQIAVLLSLLEPYDFSFVVMIPAMSRINLFAFVLVIVLLLFKFLYNNIIINHKIIY